MRDAAALHDNELLITFINQNECIALIISCKNPTKFLIFLPHNKFPFQVAAAKLKKNCSEQFKTFQLNPKLWLQF